MEDPLLEDLTDARLVRANYVVLKVFISANSVRFAVWFCPMWPNMNGATIILVFVVQDTAQLPQNALNQQGPNGEGSLMCVICMDEIDILGDPDRNAVTECLHEFHSDCLVQHFQTANNCPVCRRVLVNIAN